MPNRVWRTIRFIFLPQTVPSLVFIVACLQFFPVNVFSLCGVHIDVDPDTGITVTYGPSQIRGRWMRHCCFMVSSISNEEQCSCFTWARACPQQASGKLLHAVKCRASTETTGLLFLNELPQSALSAAWAVYGPQGLSTRIPVDQCSGCDSLSKRGLLTPPALEIEPLSKRKWCVWHSDISEQTLILTS